MNRGLLIPGRWVPNEVPDWTGLEALLPLALCGPFMWMGEVHLDDGTLIGEYKHYDTRRYLHLDMTGAAYGYRDGEYCRVRHHDAIEHAFDPAWILSSATDEEKAALPVAFDEACKRDEDDYKAGLSLPPIRI